MSNMQDNADMIYFDLKEMVGLTEEDEWTSEALEQALTTLKEVSSYLDFAVENLPNVESERAELADLGVRLGHEMSPNVWSIEIDADILAR